MIFLFSFRSSFRTGSNFSRQVKKPFFNASPCSAFRTNSRLPP
jgi:hypothetical protein